LVKKKFLGILSISLSLAVISTIGVYAETSTIPDWVKNNAKWWSEGQIGESDFIGAMQYLINQDIITIPVTSAVATDVNLSENDRVMHIVVTYNGEIFGTPQTIYTYSEFQHLSNSIRTGSTGTITVDSTTPQFFLGGLPSKDKQDVYRLVDEYINPGRPPSTYGVQVDLLTGDGKIIQTWDYRKCDIIDYVVYLDTNEFNYRFADKDEPEYREITLWECAGFSIVVP